MTPEENVEDSTVSSVSADMRVQGKTADTVADTVADTESAFSKRGDTRAARVRR